MLPGFPQTHDKTRDDPILAHETIPHEMDNHFTTTHITNVTWSIENNHAFLKGELYSPIPQQTVNGHIFDISGWVLAQDDPIASIEVQWEDTILFKTSLESANPETRRLDPYRLNKHRGGFRVPINALMLPEEFVLQIYVTLSEDTRENIGIVSGKRSPVIYDYKPSLQPLTVIGLPRSGTTLLMNYLSNHPAIIAHKKYPYEFMALSYWLHFFRVLSAQADLTSSTNPQFYLSDPYFIGHHPNFAEGFDPKIAAWFQEEYSLNLLTFCLQSIEGSYQKIATTQNKPDLKYFAEKLHRPNPTYPLQWSLYPQSHSVFIVRDFRDQYCSALAFTAKHGFDNLLPNDFEAETDIVTRTRKNFMLYYNIWKQNPEQIHLVRYEDLILHPRETIAQLLKQLGIGLDTNPMDKLLADTARDTQEYASHLTAQSSTDSIGRWRTELNPQLKTLYKTHLGDILSEFGYEV